MGAQRVRHIRREMASPAATRRSEGEPKRTERAPSVTGNPVAVGIEMMRIRANDRDRPRHAQRAEIRAVEIGRGRRNTCSPVARVAAACRSRRSHDVARRGRLDEEVIQMAGKDEQSHDHDERDQPEDERVFRDRLRALVGESVASPAMPLLLRSPQMTPPGASPHRYPCLQGENNSTAGRSAATMAAASQADARRARVRIGRRRALIPPVSLERESPTLAGL